MHHEITLSAPPLCLEWIPYTPGTKEKTNLIAIGSFLPTIEIWNLDVIDAIEPLMELGGYSDGADPEALSEMTPA